MQPLVTIVVITYNTQDFVLETLESIRKQTYPNIELIISDDGSKDETVSLCNNWLQANSKLTIKFRLYTKIGDKSFREYFCINFGGLLF